MAGNNNSDHEISKSRPHAAAASVLVLVLAACAQVPSDTGADAEADARMFVAAIDDAAVRTDVYSELVAITPSDPRLTWRDDQKQRLLVATWKSEADARSYFPPAGGSAKTSDKEAYVLWVTAVPQLKQFCQSLGMKGTRLSRRLKQYLGLNPARGYDRVIEIWVDPHDMFRPCPDPEADDKQCNAGWAVSPKAPGVADYGAFFRYLYAASYSINGAPWTRLGYTYDWAPGAKKFGASEFILAPNSSYEVKAIYSTDEYCRR